MTVQHNRFFPQNSCTKNRVKAENNPRLSFSKLCSFAAVKSRFYN